MTSITESRNEEYAIYVQHAKKSYSQNTILYDFCMKVPRSSIYALLGASGCGKSTLLNCLVGRQKLNSGDIFVLGSQPGLPGFEEMGPRIGYMPQDIALVAEFNVKDTIFFFGRIMNMDDDMIGERFRNLTLLLDLPPENRLLKNCSGGQQRRISLAVAMIHNPELLILDEPTVGLDPIMRANIWNHLVRIADEEQTTVLITTHYVEEARQAHKIAFMRGGKQLAEASPDQLLALFNTDKLEDVYFALSRHQEEGRQVIASQTSNYFPHVNSTMKKSFCRKVNRRRIKSLFVKNFKQLVRNPSGLLFTFFFPLLQMLTFIFAIGADPKNIPIAFVDEENANNCRNYNKIDTAVPYLFSNCKFSNLSCRFRNEMQDPTFELIPYNNTEYAFEDVRHGKVGGVINIVHNFSKAFTNRVNDGRLAQDQDIDFGEVKVWMDMSNRQIGDIIKARIYKLYQKFIVSISKNCNFEEKYGEAPIRLQFEFGTEKESFTDFMAPGLLLTVIYFVGALLTSTLIITDQSEGIWDRCIVAGVTSFEIIISHFFTQVFLLFLQTIEVIVTTFVICGIDYVGNMWLIFLIIFTQGICGMSLGLFISTATSSYLFVLIILTGLFYPTIYLSGVFWPLEGQPIGLRYFSQSLPVTLSTISLRLVMKKNLGLEDIGVSLGLGVMLLWTIVCLVVSTVALRAKH